MNTEVKTICQAISRKKGVLIRVLDVRELTTIADYFILTSTRNKKQSQAVADEIEEALAGMNEHIHRKEGYREGDWILLDCGSIIVHIFTDEERRHVELDTLWSEAPVEEYHDADEEEKQGE
jgi:ribosome-associated protein